MAHMQIYQMLACGMTDYTLIGVVRVTWPLFLKFCPNYIFGVCELGT